MKQQFPQCLITVACLIFVGCERKASEAVAANAGDSAPAAASNSPAQSAAGPSTAPVVMHAFEHKDTGLHAQYPDNWKTKKDKDYELMLVPADGSAGRQITIDVPDLPPTSPA